MTLHASAAPRVRRVLGAILLVALLSSQAAMAAMVKEVAFGMFTDAPSELDADFYYRRIHGPQIMRLSGPWLHRYQAFRSFGVGGDVESALGLRRGWYGELWFDSEESYRTRPPLEAVDNAFWLKPGQRGDPDKALLVVRAAAEHVFKPAAADTQDAPVLRWVTMIEYPAGVSRTAADDWFFKTHGPEAARQPGLLRLACHEAALPERKGENGDWIRVCEYWYRNAEAFRNAVLLHPPAYTPPPWGGRYPFVRMASTLIGTTPDADFLK